MERALLSLFNILWVAIIKCNNNNNNKILEALQNFKKFKFFKPDSTYKNSDYFSLYNNYNIVYKSSFGVLIVNWVIIDWNWLIKSEFRPSLPINLFLFIYSFHLTVFTRSEDLEDKILDIFCQSLNYLINFF